MLWLEDFPGCVLDVLVSYITTCDLANLKKSSIKLKEKLDLHCEKKIITMIVIEDWLIMSNAVKL